MTTPKKTCHCDKFKELIIEAVTKVVEEACYSEEDFLISLSELIGDEEFRDEDYQVDWLVDYLSDFGFCDSIARHVISKVEFVITASFKS
jgi:hypothetical protein